MDTDKPFKNIEVLDSRTGQLCKVACMSCIRGHRTTSCGIPVCRTKIFWTVKRPGRPSNSCTCRFGPTGRCQCVVAKSACPHKPKKGEKRSIECRCDEQGRYCCLLEPEHWDALCALQKPKVDFFTHREALDARHASPPAASFPPTPSLSAGTPQTVMSVPGTPTPGNGIQFVHTTGEHFESPSPARTVPRFGMMGVGAPLGDNHQGQDVLSWDGQSPQAPREYRPYTSFKPDNPQPQTPMAMTSPPSTTPYHYTLPPDSDFQQPELAFQQMDTPFQHLHPPTQQPPISFTSPDLHFQHAEFAPSDFASTEFPPPTQSLSALTLPAEDLHPSHLDLFMANFNSYQLPSAICQNCGMNGCTCRNCPAVMQNFESGSWAQCCARKHVKYPASAPQGGVQASGLLQRQPIMGTDAGGGCCGSGARDGMQTSIDPTLTQDMQVEQEVEMLDGVADAPMELSDLLWDNLEEQQPSGGCCCRD
jgi:hypothetical protein